MSSNGHALIEEFVPYSQECEEALIGCLIVNPSYFSAVSQVISGRDFFILRHQHIFEAIERLWERHDEIDYVTVTHELRTMGKLDDIGGAAHLSYLCNAMPTTVHAPIYASLVQRAAIRRRLMTTCDRIKNEAVNESTDILRLAELAQSEIFNVTDIKDETTMASMRELASAHFDKMELVQRGETFGIPTGYNQLDKLLGGFKRKKLYVIAGRPGMGKTGFLQTAALSMARMGARILFLSMEMSLNEVMDRFVAIETGINLEAFAEGLTPEQNSRYVNALDRLSRLPIVIDEKARLTPTTIRAKTERVMQAQGVDAVIVDYMQLARGDEDKRYGTQEQEIADISSSLKELAKDLNIPVIAAAQFNRNGSGRADRTPILEDLRGSGQIEQDADVVIFLHSEDYYLPKPAQPVDFDTQVIVGKNRSGPMGEVHMTFKRPITKFVEG